MATEIYNEGPCIRIIKNGQELLVTKVQIKRIDSLRSNLLRIDNGEGALKHIYLDINDITVPQTYSDVISLRDTLLGWLRMSAAAKEAKQDMEINELQQIRIALQNLSLGGGVKSSAIMEPLREDESQPNIVYKGYALPDAQTYDPVWAIVRISRIEDQIIYKWADGNQNYDNIWNNRYLINYSAGVKGPVSE